MKKRTLKKYQAALKLSDEQVDLLVKFMQMDEAVDDKHLPNKTYAWVRDCYNPPTLEEKHLQAIEDIGGWYGREPIPAAMRTRDVRFEVFGAGDTYASTLVYDREKEKFFVSTLGDMVEYAERKGIMERE